MFSDASLCSLIGGFAGDRLLHSVPQFDEWAAQVTARRKTAPIVARVRSAGGRGVGLLISLSLETRPKLGMVSPIPSFLFSGVLWSFKVGVREIAGSRLQSCNRGSRHVHKCSYTLANQDILPC